MITLTLATENAKKIVDIFPNIYYAAKFLNFNFKGYHIDPLVKEQEHQTCFLLTYFSGEVGLLLIVLLHLGCAPHGDVERLGTGWPYSSSSTDFEYLRPPHPFINPDMGATRFGGLGQTFTLNRGL